MQAGDQQALPAPVLPPITQNIPAIGAETTDTELYKVVTELLQVGQDLVYPVARDGVTPQSVSSAFTRVHSGARIYAQVAELLKRLLPQELPPQG